MSNRSYWFLIATTGLALGLGCGGDDASEPTVDTGTRPPEAGRAPDADAQLPPDASPDSAATETEPDTFVEVRAEVGLDGHTVDAASAVDVAAPIVDGTIDSTLPPSSGTCSAPTSLMFSSTGHASAEGELAGAGANLDDGTNCVSTGPYAVYRFTTTAAQQLSVVATSPTDKKLLLSLRAASCEAGDLKTCNGGLSDRLSTITEANTTYYLFVRAAEAADVGRFSLKALLIEPKNYGISCDLPHEQQLYQTEEKTWRSGGSVDHRNLAWYSAAGTSMYYAVPIPQAGTLTITAAVTEGNPATSGSLQYQIGRCTEEDSSIVSKPLTVSTPVETVIPIAKPTTVYFRVVGNWAFETQLRLTIP